ncbi:hypothetical protein [Gordonia paraffinivorans]|uniref:hypothetical protein n=1 Tax=Gordonia paraffinivorans TaxID=175628 RepID=UPI0011B2507A|nr:hypothetical protein [Gordonia paraffinivorans]
MTFEVRFATGDKAAFQGRYEISDAGVLVIVHDDEERGVVSYSPSYWTSIRHAKPEEGSGSW